MEAGSEAFEAAWLPPVIAALTGQPQGSCKEGVSRGKGDGVDSAQLRVHVTAYALPALLAAEPAAVGALVRPLLVLHRLSDQVASVIE